MIFKIRSVLHKVRRSLDKPKWHELRRITPISTVFGLDRGTPIDRYYIERFLEKNRSIIKGRVLEVAENTYTQRFGTSVQTSDVLHYDSSNRQGTIVGDLTSPSSLPRDSFDCFICTQTLNFIYDVRMAVQGIHRVLKPGGTTLVTLAGISQISRYDMDRWGDYWRFTTKSALRCFADVFGDTNVTVQHHGNVLSAIAFLEGLACDELTPEELDHVDQDYQVVITIVATKSL